MKKYLLPLLLASKCLFSQAEVVDETFEVIPAVTQEAYTTFVKDLSAADNQWKNEEKEEALQSYTTLLENSTNPLFTMAIRFRKGILESQLGRQEEALASFRSLLDHIVTFGDLATLDPRFSDEKTLRDHYASTLIKVINTPDSVRHCPNSICLCSGICQCPQTVCPR